MSSHLEAAFYRASARNWRPLELEPGLNLLSTGLYVTARDRDPWRSEWPHLPWWSYAEAETVLRDANGRDGLWHAVVTLPHEAVDVKLGEPARWVEVPMFEVVDLERAAWRRRPWFGSRAGARMPMWRL